jgi:hypothetical protein
MNRIDPKSASVSGAVSWDIDVEPRLRSRLETIGYAATSNRQHDPEGSEREFSKRSSRFVE